MAPGSRSQNTQTSQTNNTPFQVNLGEQCGIELGLISHHMCYLPELSFLVYIKFKLAFVLRVKSELLDVMVKTL